MHFTLKSDKLKKKLILYRINQKLLQIFVNTKKLLRSFPDDNFFKRVQLTAHACWANDEDTLSVGVYYAIIFSTN